MEINNESQQKLERLQRDNQLKTSWISHLTHDFREIFGNILWLSEALETKTISYEEFIQLLPRIKQDAQKNLKTVTDTNLWLKTQGPDFTPEKIKISSQKLFENLETRFIELLDSNKIKLEFIGNLSEFYSDPFMIDFILEKLTEIILKSARPDSRIVLEVSENDRKIIFKIESSEDSKVKENELSVLLVKDLVQKLNGEICFGSGAETGISVYLPS